MLIEHLLDLGEAEAAHELSVGDLNGFYRAARVKFDTDADFAERARLRVVSLQAVYDMLDVTLTSADFAGESSYNSMLARPCPVLKADEETRASRLVLCDLTGQVIAQGLALLGHIHTATDVAFHTGMAPTAYHVRTKVHWSNARNLWMSVGRRTLPTSPVQGIE